MGQGASLEATFLLQTHYFYLGAGLLREVWGSQGSGSLGHHRPLSDACVTAVSRPPVLFHIKDKAQHQSQTQLGLLFLLLSGHFTEDVGPAPLRQTPPSQMRWCLLLAEGAGQPGAAWESWRGEERT